MPQLAAEGGFGNWVIGAGAMTSAVSDRELRAPGRLDPASYGNAFDYRYIGLAGSVRRDTIAIGAARRVGESVAVRGSRSRARAGFSVGEARALWCGVRRSQGR